MESDERGEASMADSPDTRTLREFDAACYIGMSRSWLAQARMTGDPNAPPFLKIGRSVRYLREDLDTWLAGCRRRNNTSPFHRP